MVQYYYAKSKCVCVCVCNGGGVGPLVLSPPPGSDAYVSYMY